MAYVDGFVVPVPLTHVDAYLDMSRACAVIWKDHGALEYWECVADDVKPGELTSFPQAVNLKDGETVIFSWIIYRDRDHRDAVNAAVMADERLNGFEADKIFDAKRMIYGGFRGAVEFGASAV
jgi:uncharacterized protein YbaA (DUF1428 family)